MSSSVAILLLLFVSAFLTDATENSLLVSKQDIRVNVRESDFFQLFLKNPLLLNNSALNISLSCLGDKCSHFGPDLPSTLLFDQRTSSVRLNLTGLTAGHDVIVANVLNNARIDDSQAFVRVRVGRSQVWDVMSQVVGWVYFFVWSASFWPQNVQHYRRKSVVGYSLDFAALNVTGFLFYLIFNSGLYFSPVVQALYEQRYPRSEIPVLLNDVIYALHAAAATGITLVQCYVYERNDQHMSLLGKLFTGITWTAAAIQLVLCLTGVMSWLTFLYYFSYVKLVVTSVKYVPQAWYNYKRKSTRGWSILMIYLDFTGGVNGLLQMLFIAYNFNDFRTIFGNFAKFGLSIASICYDILFLLQEYVFYPKDASSLQPPDAEKTYDRKESRQSVVSIVSVKSDSGRLSVPNLRDGSKRKKSVISVLSLKSVESVKSALKC